MRNLFIHKRMLRSGSQHNSDIAITGVLAALRCIISSLFTVAYSKCGLITIGRHVFLWSDMGILMFLRRRPSMLCFVGYIVNVLVPL